MANGQKLPPDAANLQAFLRRFVVEGRDKLHAQGMSDAEIDAAIIEAVRKLRPAPTL